MHKACYTIRLGRTLLRLRASHKVMLALVSALLPARKAVEKTNECY